MAEFIKNQPGPSLAAHSRTNQSLILQWLPSHSTIEDTVNLTYNIQRLTVGLEDDWLYHDDVTWLSRQRVRINGLRPYVTYKVRLIQRYLSVMLSCLTLAVGRLLSGLFHIVQYSTCYYSENKL